MTTNQQPYPANYCKTRSKIALDVQQFADMNRADRAKAGWSGRRLKQSARQLGLHDAVCPLCSEVMGQ